ncbi:Imm6 family immunity protein [Listeria booriae]|uniref:Imm6 family immunity protein n=1 Tax=Listeria booriae TaxID=1552123 RepID=UPI0016296BAF|nr:Imm6 family immunity protein [Listeria booriae]MBC2390514.1 hypothetical protein [Listeria booriae]
MNKIWEEFDDNEKKILYLSLAEKMFSFMDATTPNYSEGRKALDVCWNSLTDTKITGDDIYILIDSPDYNDIGEFAEQAEGLKDAEIWYVLLDSVAYVAWKMYKESGVKFLPQALEGIDEDRISDFIENIEKSGLMKKEDIEEVLGMLNDRDSDLTKEHIQSKLGI